MNTTILNPFVNFGDNFAICLRLCNFAGLYDDYSLHIHKDEIHVTILSCSHLELISRLSSLDFSNLLFVEVFGSTNGHDSLNDYSLLFEIYQRYCNHDSNEYFIRFYDI